MKNSIILISILIFLIAVQSCSSTDKLEKTIKSFNNSKIYIQDPILLSDILNYTDSYKKFRENQFVGNLNFEGGIIIDKKDNMRTKSKITTFSREDQFKKRIVKNLKTGIVKIFRKKKLNYVISDLNNLKLENSLTVDESIDYDRKKETIAEEGIDNINIPHKKYLFQNLKQSSQLLEFLNKHDVKFIVVPVVEYYYSHNAGWFIDQANGCGLGQRYAVQLHFFDASTGIRIASKKFEIKNINHFKYSISFFKSDLELKKLEKKILLKIEDYL